MKLKNIKYMKFIKQIRRLPAAALMLTALLSSCADSFLEQPTTGALPEESVASQTGVNALLIGAYGALDGQGPNASALGGGGPWESSPDNWIYGTVAGGVASKVSFGGDQPVIHAIAKFYTDASDGYFDTKWKALYEGINRCNSTILYCVQAEDIPDAQKAVILGEARILRGHYYFDLKKMFNMVPWIDETTEDPKTPNDVDIWPMIEADFKFAYENVRSEERRVG